MDDSRPYHRFAYLSLAVALLLSAMGTPVLKALVLKGGHFGSTIENAISYCNILFVGNLCSATIVLFFFRPTEVAKKAKKITRKSWRALLANTLLSNVISPMLVISALEDGGDIVTVILLLQTNAIFFPLFSWIIFGESVTRRCLLGLSFITVGLLALVLVPGTVHLGPAHYLAVLAAACRSLGSCLARKTLEEPGIMPVFLVLRNLLGAIGFFILAVQMFGFGHFADAFEPGLWPLMFVYAGLVVVMGQLTWFQAVSQLSSETISLWGTVVPGLAMFFAWLLLGELPTEIQWISLLVVIMGLVIAKYKTKTSQLEAIPSRSLTGN